MLVVSMVEGTRFLDVFRLPLALNVLHWLGNMVLGILGALVWAAEPVAPDPVDRAGRARVHHVSALGREHRANGTRCATCTRRDARSRPRSPPTETFGDFLGLLEKLLPADRVELVVVDDEQVAVHASTGIRSAHGRRGRVRIRSRPSSRCAPAIAPQIALVGDGEDVRGVLAVYRREVLTTKERLLLDGLAGQIAARLRNHRLYGKTLERARLSEIVTPHVRRRLHRRSSRDGSRRGTRRCTRSWGTPRTRRSAGGARSCSASG